MMGVPSESTLSTPSRVRASLSVVCENSVLRLISLKLPMRYATLAMPPSVASWTPRRSVRSCVVSAATVPVSALRPVMSTRPTVPFS